MISKKRILAGLNELIYVEEGMASTYLNFTKVLVNETELLNDAMKKNIHDILLKLSKDSVVHKKKIEDLCIKIEKDARDEF